MGGFGGNFGRHWVIKWQLLYCIFRIPSFALVVTQNQSKKNFWRTQLLDMHCWWIVTGLLDGEHTLTLQMKKSSLCWTVQKYSWKMHKELLRIIGQCLTTDNKHKTRFIQIVVFYLISPSAVNRSLFSEINSRGFVRLFCSCGSFGVSKTSCRVKKYFFYHSSKKIPVIEWAIITN